MQSPRQQFDPEHRKDEHGVRREIQTAREFIDSVLAAGASMAELLDELVEAILDRLTARALGILPIMIALLRQVEKAIGAFIAGRKRIRSYSAPASSKRSPSSPTMSFQRSSR